MRQHEKYLIFIFLSFFCSTCFAINSISIYMYDWKCCLCDFKFYGYIPPSTMECKSEKSLFHIWILKEKRYRPNIPKDKVG